LALIPLMQRGGEKGIIQDWCELVGAEKDLRRRGDYGLALVFAERAGCLDAWRDALKGFAMIESPLIAALLSQAEAKAKTEGKAEMLVDVIQQRYRQLPEEIARPIRACTDSAQLARWLSMVLEVETLAEFRQKTGL
jgi:hypothetical protein